MSQPDKDATSNQRRPSDGLDTHVRQTECQYTDSTSSPASVGLTDVLHQIPTLPELLDMDAQKALSATCRSLRERFIFRVQVVTVPSKEDYYLVAKRMWPRLSMVILQIDARNYFTAPPHQNRLANVGILAGSSNHATIVLLRPLNMPTDLPCMPLVAQQLAHQIRIKWPGMDSFGVGYSLLSSARMLESDGFGIEIVSQLIKGTWTRLASLSLPGCGLKAPGFWFLSQGNWPLLKNLNVSYNCLDAEGMALLTKGNWPLLSCLNLDHNPNLDATAIACLSAANWPVQSLAINQASFSIDMAAALVDLQLSNLMRLHLDSTDVTAAAVTELARADWPCLKHLSICLDDLKAVGDLLGLDVDKINLQRQSAAHGFSKVHQREVVSQPGVVGLWPNLTQVFLNKIIFLHM